MKNDEKKNDKKTSEVNEKTEKKESELSQESPD